MADGQPLGGGYQVTRWLFLRLLGVVYLIAFVSLAVQVAGLIGPNGLLPAHAFLDWAHSTLRQPRLPPAADASSGSAPAPRRSASWPGAAPASRCCSSSGSPRERPSPAPGCSTSRSSVAGQDFLSFQWDALLLETGLLAILWAPPGWRPSRQEPPAVRARTVAARLSPLQADVPLGRHQAPERRSHLAASHRARLPLRDPAAADLAGWYAHQLPASDPSRGDGGDVRDRAGRAVAAVRAGAPARGCGTRASPRWSCCRPASRSRGTTGSSTCWPSCSAFRRWTTRRSAGSRRRRFAAAGRESPAWRRSC